jgi:hypothetical protein
LFSAALLYATGLALAQTPNLTPLQFLPGDQAISAASADQLAPVVARGGNMYLTVWQDSRGGGSGQDIWAARVDGNGKLIDQVPFVITEAAAFQTAPRGSCRTVRTGW